MMALMKTTIGVERGGREDTCVEFPMLTTFRCTKSLIGEISIHLVRPALWMYRPLLRSAYDNSFVTQGRCFPIIRILDLSENRLDAVPVLDGCSCLEELCLAGNMLTDLGVSWKAPPANVGAALIRPAPPQHDIDTGRPADVPNSASAAGCI